jgi:hypothetical protein
MIPPGKRWFKLSGSKTTCIWRPVQTPQRQSAVFKRHSPASQQKSKSNEVAIKYTVLNITAYT